MGSTPTRGTIDFQIQKRILEIDHSIRIREEAMSVVREQIQNFQEKSLILGIGGTTGFFTGGVLGLIIGTYTATKYNAAASLDGGAILGLSIAIALSIIWLVIVAVWTRKVADVKVWLRLIATNTLCFAVLTWFGYFLGALIGAIGTTLLSRLL